jgi:hypothetical protein
VAERSREPATSGEGVVVVVEEGLEEGAADVVEVAVVFSSAEDVEVVEALVEVLVGVGMELVFLA